MTIQFVFLILAFLCFVAGAVPFPSRVNLTSLGLAFWVLTLIVK